MIDAHLTRLLVDAVHDAERQAPDLDPVSAVARARRTHRQRRDHLAVLAFVLFVVVLQLMPADALGAPQPASAVATPAERDAGAPAPGV